MWKSSHFNSTLFHCYLLYNSVTTLLNCFLNRICITFTKTKPNLAIYSAANLSLRLLKRLNKCKLHTFSVCVCACVCAFECVCISFSLPGILVWLKRVPSKKTVRKCVNAKQLICRYKLANVSILFALSLSLSLHTNSHEMPAQQHLLKHLGWLNTHTHM